MQRDEYRIMREAEERHFWFRGSRAVIFSWIDRALAGRGQRAVALDVGAGTGGVLEALGDRCRAWGAEFHADGARYCAERGLDVVQARLPVLPFADDTFDLLVSLDVFEHIEDDLAAIREARRVLKPGGVMVTTVPALRWLWSEHDEALHHFRRYDLAEFSARLTAAGFRIQRISYYNATLLAPIAAVRLAGRALRPFRASTAAPSSDVSVPPAPINEVLTKLFASERLVLERWRLPIGASLIAEVVA